MTAWKKEITACHLVHPREDYAYACASLQLGLGILCFCVVSTDSSPLTSFLWAITTTSQEIKEVAFKMSWEGLSDKQIKQFLGIGGWTMRQLRVTYHASGLAPI